MFGKFARRIPAPATVRELVPTSDGDHVETLSVPAARDDAPHLLLLHGLEGGIRSHYARGILTQMAERGWGATLLVFRGCGSVPNTARRFYHSGETSDVANVFAVLRQRAPRSQWFALGVSLGGNVLLKWLGERGADLVGPLRAAAAISVPFDLEAGARYIGHGFSRLYDRHFVRSLRRKALAKLNRYPGLFDRGALERARTIVDFDDCVTAPVHGFAGAVDYYSRSSSMGFLTGIRVPTLLVSAEDDPFLPRQALARAARASTGNPALQMEVHATGGHVGFVAGNNPAKPFFYAEWRVLRFFEEALAARPASPA